MTTTIHRVTRIVRSEKAYTPEQSSSGAFVCTTFTVHSTTIEGHTVQYEIALYSDGALELECGEL